MLPLEMRHGFLEVFADVVGDALGGEGQVFDADLAVFGEDDGPLDDVFQFADVAAPVVVSRPAWRRW